MDNLEKIKKGLDEAFKKMVEFKKYKKTPIVVYKDGKIVEIMPETVTFPDKAIE
jgi:hypothetical protein